MEKEDYYDYKQIRTLSSFKHALIVIGIAFVSFISFEIGTTFSQESDKDFYEMIMNPAEQNVEIGQKWIYSINKNNPFKHEIDITKKVIGFKDDYVLFIQSYNDTTIIGNDTIILDNDTISEDKKYFLIGCKLLYPVNNNIFKLKYITSDENVPEYKFKFNFTN